MPAYDGLEERFNQTMAQILTSYVETRQRDWDVQLPLVMMAYRSSVHQGTKFTPNRMMFGREIRICTEVGIRI